MSDTLSPTIRTAKPKATPIIRTATKAKTPSKSRSVKPIIMGRKSAMFVGFVYNASASVLAYHIAHHLIGPAYRNGSYVIMCIYAMAIFGGLLLSFPTTYRLMLKLKGEDKTGITMSVGITLLLETGMTFCPFWPSLACLALVGLINGYSGAQQAIAKLTVD